jgi:hypothetical protein
MWPIPDEDALAATKANALPVLAMAGYVLVNHTQEQILGMRLVLQDAPVFEYSWMALRPFQYRNRLQDALENGDLAPRLEKLDAEQKLGSQRFRSACLTLEAENPPGHLRFEPSLARTTFFYPIHPNEAVIVVERADGQHASALLDILGIHAFIELVDRAALNGLVDEDDIE